MTASKKLLLKFAKRRTNRCFGKLTAPRNIIEMHFGKEGVAHEAFEIVANKVYSEALDTQNLIPVDDPKVVSSVFEEGKDMELVITVTVKPEPELGEYKEPACRKRRSCCNRRNG